jgi:hypothetical protein
MWACWPSILILPTESANRSKILSVGTQKPLAVEVDYMAWRLSNPDFSFPGDVAQVLYHSLLGHKGCHEDQASPGPLEEVLKLKFSFWINRSMAGNSFDQYKPIFIRIMNNKIRHLAVLIRDLTVD